MLRRIAQKSFVYFLGTILNRGLAFLLVPIYTYYLAPEEYGILALSATTAAIFGQIFLLSLHAAVVLFYVKLNEIEYRRFLAALWLVATFAPLVFVFVLNALGSQYSGQLFPAVSWHPYLSISLWIAYLTVIQSIAASLFRVKEQSLLFTAFNFAAAALTGIFALAFIIWGKMGVLGILYGQTLSFALIGILSHLVIIREFLPWSGLGWRHLSKALILYLPLMPHLVGAWLLNLSDRWILGGYVSLADLGIYSIAYTIGMIVWSVGEAQSLSFSPIYFKNAEDENFKRDNLPKLLTLFTIIPTYIGTSIAVLSPEILTVLTRPVYHSAAAIVPFIILAYWFYAVIYQPYLTVIEYHQKTRWILAVSAPATILNIILNLIFIPRYGIFAAAFNTTLAFAMMGILAMAFSSRLEKLPIPWRLLTPISVLCFITFLISNFWLSLYSFQISLIIKCFMLLFVGVVILKISGLPVSRIKKILKPQKDVLIN